MHILCQSRPYACLRHLVLLCHVSSSMRHHRETRAASVHWLPLISWGTWEGSLKPGARGVGRLGVGETPPASRAGLETDRGPSLHPVALRCGRSSSDDRSGGVLPPWPWRSAARSRPPLPGAGAAPYSDGDAHVAAESGARCWAAAPGHEKSETLCASAAGQSPHPISPG